MSLGHQVVKSSTQKNIEMKKVMRFYDLEIWKEAHKLSIEIYKLTEKFPDFKSYGIIRKYF